MALLNSIQAASQLQGRKLIWAELDTDELDQPPTLSESGTPVQQSVAAAFAPLLRETAGRRSARVTATSNGANGLDTTVYTVTINGQDISFDTGSNNQDDDAALRASIAQAITTFWSTRPLEVDAVVQTDGSILVQSDRDFSIDVSVSGGGGGTLTATADATSARMRLYGKYMLGAAGTTAPSGWRLIHDENIDGHQDFFMGGVGRFTAVYMQLQDIQGHPQDGSTVTITSYAFIGRAIADEDQLERVE